MNKFDTPWDYPEKNTMGAYKIIYADSYEVCQGGPRTGHLVINDEPVPDYIFGGPILEYEPFIFVPVYIFLRFRLARINCETLEVKILKEERTIIDLEKIEDGRIYFYENMYRTKSSYYELTEFDSRIPFHPMPYRPFWRTFLDMMFPGKFFKDE